MSGATFTTPVQRGQDPGGDIEFVGLNYGSNRLIVRFKKMPSGDVIDVVYEGARLVALRSRVTQLNGLRLALLQDMLAQGEIPAGSAT